MRTTDDRQKGVVYLICGMKVAERLVVSVWSLRQHYDGPITIMVTNDEERTLLDPLITQLCVHIQRVEPDVIKKGTQAYLAKSRIPEWTPYEDTVFLDADTLVVGSINELFGHPLTLTQNAEWVTTGRRSRKWIKMWYDLDVSWITIMANVQLKRPHPLINIGVFQFQKGRLLISRWHELTSLYPDHPLPEQTAMQLLTTILDHRILDDRFNRLSSIGVATEDIRIWHFHGLRHCKPEATCGEIWLPAFEQAYKDNVGGLQRWAGKYDRRVKRWLEKV